MSGNRGINSGGLTSLRGAKFENELRLSNESDAVNNVTADGKMARGHIKEPMAQTLGFLAPILGFLFVAAWALEPTIFGAASVIFPPLRWVLCIIMVLLAPLSSPRGLGLGWPAILFAAVLGFTLLFDAGRQDSFPIYARIVSAVALAVFAGSLRLEQRVAVAKGAIACCLIVTFASLLLGLVAPDVAFKLIGTERLRLYGVTPHPGTLGYLAAIGGTTFLSSACFAGRSRSIAKRLRDVLIGIAMLTALFLADSRTGQIATALSLFFAFVVFSIVRKRLIKRKIFLVWLIFGFAYVAATIVPIGVATGVIGVSSTENRYEGSTEGRVTIWQAGLDEFHRNRLTGAGLASTFRTSDMRDEMESIFYYHSVLINYLAKGGVLVGGALILLLLAVPWSILSGARRFSRSISRKVEIELEQVQQRQLESADRTLLLFANATGVVTLVFSVTEAALQNMYPSFLMFFLALTLPSRSLD